MLENELTHLRRHLRALSRNQILPPASLPNRPARYRSVPAAENSGTISDDKSPSAKEPAGSSAVGWWGRVILRLSRYFTSFPA